MTRSKARVWGGNIGVILVLILFSSGLFSRCANVSGAPQGGPKDTIPPRVVRMNPRFNATGINPKRITIEFDEYVQLKELQKEFFVSPMLETKPTVTVKNRGIVIDMKSPLDSATTYVMNLGSSVADNNEGNLYHGLKYTFSTGDHIDSMYMSGFVSNALSADTVKGAFIYFFDARRDTVGDHDSLVYKPIQAASISRTTSNGGFINANLKPVDYRIYAVMDKNGNSIYDPGVDEVAFLDSLYNPGRMPSFLMWYDSVRMYPVAQPQVFLRTFTEDPERRQNLSDSKRLSAQQIMLKFSGKHPQIESFSLEGIEPERIIRERTTENGDSILYWLNVPPSELADTIRGKIVYERHDSVGEWQSHSQDLRFIFAKPASGKEDAVPELSADGSPAQEGEAASAEPVAETKRQRRRREKAERRAAKEAENSKTTEEPKSEEDIVNDILESEREAADTVVYKSTMVFAFAGENPVIPGISPTLSFDLPVNRFDTDSARLVRTIKIPQNDGTETERKESIPVRFVRDSMHLRQYAIEAEWTDGGSYTLDIPFEAIQTIDGEVNAPISHSFTVANNAEMGTLTINLTDTVPEYEYIVQIVSGDGKTVQREVSHLTGGTNSIHYITPGKIRIRLIEDRNRNGKWDTGQVVRRIQPEPVRFYQQPDGNLEIDIPAESELLLDVSAVEIFQPRVHVETPIEEHTHDHDHDHDHDHGTPAAIAEGEADPAVVSERTNLRASGEGVEAFDIFDPKADRKAQKAAKRAAREERKRARRAASSEGGEDVLTGAELNTLMNEKID